MREEEKEVVWQTERTHIYIHTHEHINLPTQNTIYENEKIYILTNRNHQIVKYHFTMAHTSQEIKDRVLKKLLRI